MTRKDRTGSVGGEAPADAAPAVSISVPPMPAPPLGTAVHVLRAAAARLALSWENESGEAVDEREFQEELTLLLRVLESEQTPPDWTPTSTASLILRRRLVDRLRTEVLADWAEAEHDSRRDPESVLTALRSLERAQAGLEPRWDQRFPVHLAAPGGMDLVVEVTHDLRSPLTSILFLSETLRKGQSGEVNDIQHRQLGIIYSAALALTTVVSDVIDLARDGNHLFDTEPSPFSVTEVLQHVYDIVQPMTEEKGLTLWISPPATDQRIGYPIALSRVLLNLTTNAIKFTEEGGVEITATPHGLRHLEFSVRDTGRGINPDVMATLYQPFRRVRARSGFYFSGSGLGLAICRRLVEAMGSRLEVETRPDWGTRFYFTLELPPAGAT